MCAVHAIVSRDDEDDKQAALGTLGFVLAELAKVMAPFTPFLADEMYMNLTKEESVHLASWPEYKEELINKQLNEEMNVVRKIVEIGHAKRKETGFKVRQPLGKCQISNVKYPITSELQQLLNDELNVKAVEIIEGDGEIEVMFDTVLTPELKAEGEARDIVRKIQEERKMIGTTLDAKVNVTIPEYPESFVEYIKQNALVEIISKGEFKVEKVG
jgi:isoleucyl-tRNA synthetase